MQLEQGITTSWKFITITGIMEKRALRGQKVVILSFKCDVVK